MEVLLKSFTPVSDFTEETPQSAYGCQLPFRGACCVNCLCVLVQPCQNRPAEFARYTRCPPVACQRRWLPFPVSVMLIFKCFLVQVGDFISYGVCKFAFLGSPLRHPKGVPCAELSPQVTEGFPATAANRFHKELRFFFSLLKRKKKQKRKEFAFHLYCKIPISPEDYTRNCHNRFSSTKLPGGANRRLPPP